VTRRRVDRRDKMSRTIQRMVDTASEAEYDCTDGYDVVYPGKHIYNVCNKNDTFTVEGVNADLRHDISTLARRSRDGGLCFAAGETCGANEVSAKQTGSCESGLLRIFWLRQNTILSQPSADSPFPKGPFLRSTESSAKPLDFLLQQNYTYCRSKK